MNMGLRTRLIGTLLVATLIFFAISAIAAKVTMSNDLNALGAEQVQSGSTAFGGYWDQKREQVRVIVGQIGIQDTVRDMVVAKKSKALADSLSDLARQSGLSFLVVVDPNGRVVGGANDILPGTLLATSRTKSALNGASVSSAAVLGREELEQLQLIEQVQAAVKDGSGDSSKGMAILAAAPLTDARDHTLGAVYGGVLINHNYDLVDNSTTLLGGKTAVLLGDTVVSGTITNDGGARLVDVALPAANAVAVTGKPWSGIDTEDGTAYVTTITPIVDDQRQTIGALWYGVPQSKYTSIETHTVVSILLWGLVALLVALLVSIPVFNSISKSIIRRSKQVSESAKELSFVVVGSEVSGDHVARTLQTVERAGGLIGEIANAETACASGGGNGVATLVSEKVQTLASLNGEIHGDVIVIDTLAREMSERMRDAERRVAELNDVAKGLRKLVTGSTQ